MAPEAGGELARASSTCIASRVGLRLLLEQVLDLDQHLGVLVGASSAAAVSASRAKNDARGCSAARLAGLVHSELVPRREWGGAARAVAGRSR